MINLIIGIFGMLLILIAFILDEFVDKFNQNTVQYNLTNILGSGLLTYYAFTLNSIPFIILNVVWFLAAGYKLFKIIQ
jgi:hypothetical protein